MGKYQATPKVNLSLNTSYIMDTTLLEELLASGVVINRSPRHLHHGKPGDDVAISPNACRATVNYNFNRVLYQAPQCTLIIPPIKMGLSFNYLLKNEKDHSHPIPIWSVKHSIQVATTINP